MSTISRTPPVSHERLVLLQPVETGHMDSDGHEAVRRSLTAQLHDALKSGLALGHTATAIRNFREGEDLVLFQLPGALVIGKVVPTAAAQKAYAASKGGRRSGLWD